MLIDKIKEKGKEIYQRFLSKKTKAIILNINIQNKIVKVMTCDSKDYSSIVINTKRYEFPDFSDAYYEMLVNMVVETEYYKNYKDETSLYISLPNEYFTYDLIEIPTVKKHIMNDSLEIKKIDSYKHKNELLTRSCLIHSNKKISTYLVRVVKKELIKKLYSIFSDIGMYPKGVTIASNSLISGISHFDSKLFNQSYLFLDIKDNYSIITISDKGKCSGYYYLGFGENILNSTKLEAESKIFNHDFSEKVILESEAKAKGLDISSMKSSFINSNDEIKNKDQGLDYLEENFKIFLKWIALVKRSYENNGSDFLIDNVYINMPIKYHDLLAKVDMNIVPFSHNLGIPEEYLYSLDMYGVLYPNKITKQDYL